ncbi:MAG: hypothetical protein JEZ03_00495 [Bacteroidales bacterium]|nr:hypothetical protein [Bacteroidales bacterium]
MKNIFYFILSISSVLIILYSIVLIKSNYDYKLISCVQNAELSKEESIMLRNLISNNLLLSNPNLGYQFDLNVVVEDVNLNQNRLVDLLSGENMLIFRVSESHCSSCDLVGLQCLEKNNSNIPERNIIIVGSFYNTKRMMDFKDEYNITSKMYNLKQSVNIGAEEHNFPYFIVINKDLVVLSCFFPEKSLPKFIDDYFLGIEHFFN